MITRIFERGISDIGDTSGTTKPLFVLCRVRPIYDCHLRQRFSEMKSRLTARPQVYQVSIAAALELQADKMASIEVARKIDSS